MIGIVAYRASSSTLGNDTLVAGSVHSLLQTSLTGTTTTAALGGNTINVTGQTAASALDTTSTTAKGGATATISLSDKTTDTLVGIPSTKLH